MTKTVALTIEETDDAVIIKQDGVEIDIGPNHSVVVHTDGDVKVQLAAANDTAVKAAKAVLEVGDKMQDGSIFAGISPDTGKQMFAMPADAGLSITFYAAAQHAQKLNSVNTLAMTFNEAAQCAKNLNILKYLGHDDWRVPTKAELNVLFENREKGALKGTFKLTGSDPSGWYWSGTPFDDSNYAYKPFDDHYAYCQRFSDGLQHVILNRDLDASVRCVR
jgi:hypothetical protein